MTPEDKRAIKHVVKTFRRGAPMTIDDLRIASAVDGYPLNHLSSRAIAPFLKTICDGAQGRYGEHDYHYYYRR